MTRTYNDAITIGGVDVLSYLYNYRIKSTKDINDITEGSIRLQLGVLDALSLTSGMEVIISRGETTSTDFYVLRGNVMRFDEEDGLILLTVRGRLAQYKRKLVTYSYDKNIDTEAGNPVLIWADIVEGGGLTASYVNTTEVALDKFICNDSYRFERMGVLAKLLGYQQRDDYTNNYVRLEPVGYTSFSTKLVVGENITNIPVWKEDLEPMRNYIKIRGAFVEDTKVEIFNGDGTETDFAVQHEPEITKVLLDGVEQIRGVVDSTATYDYTVDKQLKTFTFVAPPPVDVGNVVIEYTYRRPRPVDGKDYNSIETYGIQRDDVFELDDIETVADAKERLKQFLNYLSIPAISTTIETYGVSGIEAGMVVEIADQNNSKYDGTYIVNKITYQYPEPFDLLEIGGSDFSTEDLLTSINDRLSALEADFELNQDELTSIIRLLRSTRLENRYTKIQKATANSAMAILDHPTQSTLDNKWLLFGGSKDIYSVHTLIPGNNQFKEYVTDEDFYDFTTSTGVTFTTATNTISIAASGVYYSDAISINAEYFNYTVSLGTVSATGLTIEISPDGKSSWEIVTLDTLTEFVGTVSNVYLRITNTTVGTITINPTTDDAGQFTKPAIEVDLE